MKNYLIVKNINFLFELFTNVSIFKLNTLYSILFQNFRHFSASKLEIKAE